MSKRAEERGLEALPPRWRKTKDGKGRVDGALPVRKFYIRAYEQAEKDTIERAVAWLKDNAEKYIAQTTESYPDAPFTAIIGGKCWDDLKEYMGNE